LVRQAITNLRGAGTHDVANLGKVLRDVAGLSGERTERSHQALCLPGRYLRPPHPSLQDNGTVVQGVNRVWASPK